MMMGINDGQIEMILSDLSEIIPHGHLLRGIDKQVSLDFVYELIQPYYSDKGRPSIDPVSLKKCCW